MRWVLPGMNAGWKADLPYLGVGVGYRRELDRQIHCNREYIDWLELITEHFIQGPPERVEAAYALRDDFLVVPHGIEMSIGTDGDLDAGYLDALRGFVGAVRAPWFSDHLCFTKAGGIALGHLIPLVRSRRVARELAFKAQSVQQQIGAPFLLENITYQFELNAELSESEFICDFLNNCDCGLLLDLTNVYVNAVNHRFDPYRFLDSLPLERVVQIHLSGGSQSPAGIVDSHSSPVPEEVFQLLGYIMRASASPKGILIERDQDYPEDFGEIVRDIERVRLIMAPYVA